MASGGLTGGQQASLSKGGFTLRALGSFCRLRQDYSQIRLSPETRPGPHPALPALLLGLRLAGTPPVSVCFFYS